MRILLVIFFLCFAQIVAACPTAADLADGGTEPGAALDRCRELGRFEIPSGRGNIPVVMWGTRASDEQYILPILEALTFSGDSLADLGTLTTHPIDVFISPNSYVPLNDERAEASATRSVDDTRCIISMFPEVLTDEYRFVLAHEFFHCVQFRAFSDQQLSAGANWWYEGTSEWFANYTYRGTSFSDRYVAEFDEISVDIPITKMQYSNVVFFFWYSQNRGDGAIIDLITGMPTGGGSQEDALAGMVDDAAFLQFAKDYIDQKIKQPGGSPIPSVAIYTETTRWESDETESFEAKRFLIYRVRFEFQCGEWEVEQLDLQGMTAMQKLPEGEWEDVPETITSSDGEDVVYRFIGVATGPDEFSVDIKAKKKLCSLCPMTIVDDSPEACLVGEWRLVSGGLGAKIGELLQSTELENVDYPDLDGVLVFNEDGTFSARTNDDGHLESATESGNRIIGDVDFTFETNGTWGVNGERLEQCSLPPDINIKLDALETRTGITSTINQNEYLGPQRENRTARKFTCESGRLTMTEGGFFAPKIEWVYAK